MPLSVKSATKYLKGLCKHWNPNLVHLYRAGATLQIVLVSEGKLLVIGTSPEKWGLERYAPQIDEVMEGKPFDTRTYHQAYTHLTPAGEEYDQKNPVHYKTPGMFTVKVLVGSVFYTAKDDGTCCKVRTSNVKYAKNLGFETVGKTPNALSMEEWIAENS